MENEQIPINIGNINEGAIIDGFDIELRKVLANIADVNTPATDVRSIKLEVIFKPHSDRCTIETEVKWGAKYASLEVDKGKMFAGRTDEGHIVAFTSDPRQMPLWAAPRPKEPSVIQFDSGGAQK